MLKTVGDGEILVSDLNVDATQTDRFWAALGEYGAFTAEDLVSLASPDYERANTMATIAFDGSPGRDATVRPERA